MTAIATTHLASARPKIHRPPAFLLEKPQAPTYKKRPLPGLLLAGGLFVVLAGGAFLMRGNAPTHGKDFDISVTSATIPAQSEERLESTSFLPTPISDAQAAGLNPEKISKTIILRGNSESIVGQMARIPIENEQITEIKPVSDIDNNAGHELLSIISKY